MGFVFLTDNLAGNNFIYRLFIIFLAEKNNQLLAETLTHKHTHTAQEWRTEGKWL